MWLLRRMVLINEIFLACVSFVIAILKNCIYLGDAKLVDNKDQVRHIWHTFKEKGEGSAQVKENKDKYSSSSEDFASENEEEID